MPVLWYGVGLMNWTSLDIGMNFGQLLLPVDLTKHGIKAKRTQKYLLYCMSIACVLLRSVGERHVPRSVWPQSEARNLVKIIVCCEHKYAPTSDAPLAATRLAEEKRVRVERSIRKPAKLLLQRREGVLGLCNRLTLGARSLASLGASLVST